MCNALAHVEKSRGAGTKRCEVLLALALVCSFYLLRKFVTWSNEVQELIACQIWHFLF